MKETGIMFTPDNIRAILEGRKTQTRRVWKNQPFKCDEPTPRFGNVKVGDLFICPDLLPTGDGPAGQVITECESIGTYHAMGSDVFVKKHGPKNYGVPGDRLYIKEGIIRHVSISQLVGYYMDGCRVTESWEKRLTAMFMPKWAARTWLEITDVRVERVQDISEEDAKAEGATPIYPHDGIMYPDEPLSEYDYRRGFHELWDSINAKKHPWESNPYVWALTFQILESKGEGR